MHDEPGKEGTAHFLEHMIFQGNPLHKDKFETDEFSKKHTLDSLNAFTSFGNVCVHFRCLPEHVEESIEGVYQMLAHAYLREADIENERSIITQEAWSRYTNQKHVDYVRKERQNLYHDMPDRLRLSSPIGWPETVAAIQKPDLERARDAAFVQENLSVIVAGAVTEKTVAAVKSLIARLPKGQASGKPFVPETLGAPLENIWIYTRSQMGLSDNKQAQVSIGGGIPKGRHSTSAAMNLTSRLMHVLMFKKIRHGHSWCYRVDAGFGTTEDLSFGEIGTTIDPEHVTETIGLMWQIVRDVQEGKHKTEFEQEKQLSLERMKAAELTTGDIVGNVTDDLRFDGGIQSRKEIFDEFEAVTYEDVASILTDTFDSQTLITEAYLPDEYSPEEVRKSIRAGK